MVDEQKDERNRRGAIIVAAVLAAGVAAFIIQNRGRVTVKWLFFTLHPRLFVVEFVTIGSSIVAAELVSIVVRRSRSKRGSIAD
jgi:hypothetical protein